MIEIKFNVSYFGVEKWFRKWVVGGGGKSAYVLMRCASIRTSTVSVVFLLLAIFFLAHKEK